MIISSSVHVGSIVGTILPTQLYVAGTWTLTGPVLATTNILPLFVLPFITVLHAGTLQPSSVALLYTSEQNAGSSQNYKTVTETESPDNSDVVNSETNNKLTTVRLIAYYMPDLALFVNCSSYIMMSYALPVRMVDFNDMSLNSAVLFINLLNVFALVSSLVLGYVTRKLDVFMTMLLGSVLLYVGLILVYGSTTEYLTFPFSFEIGAVFIGFGDAAVVNLCIMSKFVLYKKWGVSNTDLGKHATTVYNAMLCLSGVSGVLVSGLTTSRDSEVTTLGGGVVALAVVTVGLLFCRMVK